MDQGMDPSQDQGAAGPNSAASRFEVLRQASLKAATTFKERANQAAAATGTAVQNATKAVRDKDWTREQQALQKVRQQAIGAGQAVAKSSAAVISRTSEGMKKVFGGPLQGIAKQENNTRPCPRIVVVCCTAIVSGGLAEPNIFREHANADDIYCLYGAFENAHGLVLPPTGTPPHVLAAVLKKFLITLPEPLLTFKVLPDFIAAADDPHAGLALLPRLPAVNFNTAHVLLETLFRVSEFAEHNGMTSAALAEEMAPCLAWHPVMKQKQGVWPWVGMGGMGGGGEDEGLMEHDGYLISPRIELGPEELKAVATVLEYLINNFRTWNEGLVFT